MFCLLPNYTIHSRQCKWVLHFTPIQLRKVNDIIWRHSKAIILYRLRECSRLINSILYLTIIAHFFFIRSIELSACQLIKINQFFSFAIAGIKMLISTLNVQVQPVHVIISFISRIFIPKTHLIRDWANGRWNIIRNQGESKLLRLIKIV